MKERLAVLPQVQGRVGFYHSQHNSFHNAILNPVEHVVATQSNYKVFRTDSMHQMSRFRPDIVVLAEHHDGFFHQALPATLVIMTRHGFSSKNYLASSMGWYDVFCVSSNWVRDEYTQKGWKPNVGFAVTGFPALDSILPPVAARTNLNLFPDGGPVLLYAPTATHSLCSAEVLGAEWIRNVRAAHPDLNILIKPHPHFPSKHPSWFNIWRGLVADDARSHLVEDSHQDVYSYFPAADILMTDASSVMFYFLAMNRPIILVNNPNRFSDNTWYDPGGHEWQWRDMGIEVDHSSQLDAAISRCLTDPNEKSAQRAMYRERVFGDLLDGKASQRIAAVISSLLTPQGPEQAMAETAWTLVANRAVRKTMAEN